jgi:hypothetical protein
MEVGIRDSPPGPEVVSSTSLPVSVIELIVEARLGFGGLVAIVIVADCVVFSRLLSCFIVTIILIGIIIIVFHVTVSGRIHLLVLVISVVLFHGVISVLRLFEGICSRKVHSCKLAVREELQDKWVISDDLLQSVQEGQTWWNVAC